MRAKRTDGNQKAIVEALRKYGAKVIVTNFGDDFPDLLCSSLTSEWVLMEVKEPHGCLDRGQLAFLSDVRCGAVAVVTNEDEAIDALRDEENRLEYREQEAIEKWLIKNPNQQSLSVKKFRKVINA